MLKSGMTVTPIRMATGPPSTSPHHPHHIQHIQQKTANSRLSNFSVASLLADTRPSTVEKFEKIEKFEKVEKVEFGLTSPTNLSISQTSQASSCSPHGSSIRQNDLDRSGTPHSSIGSEEYEESMHEDEDSIVDIEDTNLEMHEKPPSLPSGAVPIRPTPFSALAAAAAAWGGMGGGMPWQGRQMPPGFGPPGLFPPQGFPGPMNGMNGMNGLNGG